MGIQGGRSDARGKIHLSNSHQHSVLAGSAGERFIEDRQEGKQAFSTYHRSIYTHLKS